MHKVKPLWLGLITVLILCMLTITNVCGQDKSNMGWKFAWKGYDANKTTRPTLPEEEGIDIPYRGHNAEAWFDFDGDGNLEFFHDDNNCVIFLYQEITVRNHCSSISYDRKNQ